MTEQEEISEAMRLLKNNDIQKWITARLPNRLGYNMSTRRRWQYYYRTAKFIGTYLAHHRTFVEFVLIKSK